MNRVMKTVAIALPLLALAAAAPAAAEVKTREKSQVKFEGFLGRMAGMMGGKAAKDGLVTSNAVKAIARPKSTNRSDASSTSRKKRSISSTSRSRPTR
jgi:hypothetical protein